MMSDVRETVDVLGVRIDVLCAAQAVRRLEDWIQQGDTGRYVTVTGMHGVMEARDSEEVELAHEQADMSVPDGVSVTALGRVLGSSSRMSRLTGTTLVREFCRRTGSRYGHFFYGGPPSVASQMAANLQRAYGIRVLGCFSPPFRELTASERTEIRAMISQRKPNVLWIGLSTPKQELWMRENCHEVDCNVMVGVGAAFDFVAGTKERAPGWLRKAGGEWLYRFYKEPVRLRRRVLVQGPRFVALGLWRCLVNWLTGLRKDN